MGVPAHDTFGQRTPVLLQAFSSCITTIGGAQTGHKLLSSQWQRWGGAGEPHYGTNELALVVNEQQNDLDLRLPQVEFAYNNSVCVATGLAPNEIRMGRLPRLPLTVFERKGVAGHQSLAHDHLAYCDLATDR